MFFKDDDTLSYMDSNKLLNRKKKVLRDPLNEDELDHTDFFEEIPSKNLHTQKPSNIHKFIPYIKSLDWNPKHHPKLIATFMLILISIVILVIVFHETPNPLIGKWRPMGKSIILPTGDVEFTKDKIHAMNISTLVKYDIEKNKVHVIDLSNKTQVTFYIKDEKTIENNLLGIKTIYKRVEK